MELLRKFVLSRRIGISKSDWLKNFTRIKGATDLAAPPALLINYQLGGGRVSVTGTDHSPFGLRPKSLG
jgi:hypothetical protein